MICKRHDIFILLGPSCALNDTLEAYLTHHEAAQMLTRRFDQTENIICNFGFNQTPAGGQNLPYKVVFFLS